MRFDTELTEFKQAAAHVTATLTNTKTGATEQVKASYLVAADGAQSRVRAALGIGMIGVRDVYNQIASWHQQYGERWKPSALLQRLAESGTSFRDAKPAPFRPS